MFDHPPTCRRSSRRRPVTLVLALLALVLPGCFGDEEENFFEPNSTTSYAIEPADVTIQEGSTVTLQVMVTDCETDQSTGQRSCMTSNSTSCCAMWLSSSPGVASVTPGTGGTVTVTGLAEGDAEIIGHISIINGVPQTSVRTMVHVWPANMQLVVIAPAFPVLTGATVPLIAELRRPDGTVFLQGSVNWQTSDPNVATVTVDATDSHQATLVGVAPGATSITATEQTFGLSGTAPVTVTGLTVTITPATPSVPLGGTRDLTATAQLADGTAVTVPFVWESSDPAVASVSVDPTSSERATVTGASQGIAVIRARETTEGARDSTFVTVIPPVTNTFIEGTARSADASATPLAGLSVSVNHTVTGAGYRTTTDAQGEYRVPVGTGGRYSIYFQGVANFSFNQTEGDLIDVIQGQTTTFDPDVGKGYHLAITGGRGDHTAAPGATVQLFLNYTAWARSGAALATVHIAAGVDGTSNSAYSTGQPGAHPGSSGTAALTITAPAQTGDYGIYALLANTRTAPEAIDAYNGRYPDPLSFIRIGTLMVR
jgi:hypothetical protein